jgi:hypothetical protein
VIAQAVCPENRQAGLETMLELARDWLAGSELERTCCIIRPATTESVWIAAYVWRQLSTQVQTI